MIFFKTATIHDTDSLAFLVNSAYRGDSSKAGWTTEADLLDGQRTDKEALSEIINLPHNQIEMALDDNQQVIGCVHLKEEGNGGLYFGMLTVSPILQAKGLGKEIIKHVESVAREKNCNRIRISVIPQRKELIAFYERRGFVSTGQDEEFPSHDLRFGLPKVSDLKLQEYIKKL
jgi:GNAT superfamily N-acetyltransferase